VFGLHRVGESRKVYRVAVRDDIRYWVLVQGHSQRSAAERFSVIRIERERTSAYCDLCREERKREQTRERMRSLRERRRA